MISAGKRKQTAASGRGVEPPASDMCNFLTEPISPASKTGLFLQHRVEQIFLSRVLSGQKLPFSRGIWGREIVTNHFDGPIYGDDGPDCAVQGFRANNISVKISPSDRRRLVVTGLPECI